MKRALCLAGTFVTAISGSVDVIHNKLTVEEAAAVIPIPANPISAHETNDLTEQQLHHPSPHNRNLFHQLSPSTRHRRLTKGSSGTFKNLVLLLRFSDQTDRTLPSRSDISKLYNSATPTSTGRTADIAPTGSVRQVYLENSYGKFSIETTVSEWITLPHTEEYYAAGNHGFTMLKEGIIYALNHLESDRRFSFSKFDLDSDGNLDGLGVLTSGFGAEFAGTDCYDQQNNYRIWSHKGTGLNWSSKERHGKDPINVNRYYVSSALRGKCGSDIVRMGVICHEIGHYLSLPDLYDPNFVGVGIGAFDFMSQSWGFDGSGLYPPFLSAWSKVKAGWADVIEITEDGTFDIEASWKSNIVYKISSGFPDGEYLLVENRQPHSYDEKLPAGGLAIWHVDDKAKLQNNPGFPDMELTRTGLFPENSHHYQVALLSPDGNYDLEVGNNQGDFGDLWSASSNRTELTSGPNIFPNTDTYQGGIIERTGVKIFDFSASGEKMTFSVAGIAQKEEVVSKWPTLDETADISLQVTALTTPKPTTSAPTSNAPTSKPTSSSPTVDPTMPPTSPPISLRPTSFPTSESSLCDNYCLTPIDESDCPQYRDLISLPKCSSGEIPVGSQCESDGECETDKYLNNCAGYDVYLHVVCAFSDVTTNADSLEKLQPGADNGGMTNWSTSVTLDNEPIKESFFEIVAETQSPTNQPTKTRPPTRRPTNEILVMTGSGIITPQSKLSDGECPYYPAVGRSYCLGDCKQPDYMVGNDFFEFHTIHQCCELHFDANEKDSCISKTLSVMKSLEDDGNTSLPVPSVFGIVWLDKDANNRKGRKEEGVKDILIDLYDCQTKAWKEAQRTTYNGYYKFSHLLAGSYYLSITPNDDFYLSENNQRKKGRLNSDFNTHDGRTDCFELQPGGHNIKLDAGLIPNAAQLVSGQQQFPTAADNHEQATLVNSHMKHSKHSSSRQYYKAPPTLKSTSSLRGSNVETSDSSMSVNIKPEAAFTIQINASQASSAEDASLRVGPREVIIIKFDLSSLKSHDYKDAKSAVLRLYALNASPTGGLVHIAAQNTLEEGIIQVDDISTMGNMLTTLGSIRPNEWIDLDVTGALNLSANGGFSLIITPTRSNRTWVSKFSGTSSRSPPVLSITFP